MTGPVFFSSDPMWGRLNRQLSYARLLKTMSLKQGVGVFLEYSFITRGYRCELKESIGNRLSFVAEGNGLHPLGAIRDALTRMDAAIVPTVRSALLEALIDFLREEIELAPR